MRIYILMAKRLGSLIKTRLDSAGCVYKAQGGTAEKYRGVSQGQFSACIYAALHRRFDRAQPPLLGWVYLPKLV